MASAVDSHFGPAPGGGRVRGGDGDGGEDVATPRAMHHPQVEQMYGRQEGLLLDHHQDQNGDGDGGGGGGGEAEATFNSVMKRSESEPLHVHLQRQLDWLIERQERRLPDHPRDQNGGGGGGGEVRATCPTLQDLVTEQYNEIRLRMVLDDDHRLNRYHHHQAAFGSPPYWPPTAGVSGRSASSLSVDSLPPAITLRDNDTGDDCDRNASCWARGVDVVDYTVVNGSATNIGAFVVWTVRVQTLNGSHMDIRKRYSEFEELRAQLMQSFPGFEAAVPVLPPKSFISRFRAAFLEKRRAGLQYFLNCIILNPEFSASPVLRAFLFP